MTSHTDSLIQDVSWRLDYRVRLGVAWTRFMTGLENHELWATRCEGCSRTYVPPQMFCEACFEKIDDWIEVEPAGVLGASTIVYQGFEGGPEAPYAVGAIKIDDTDSQLMHLIGGVDLSDSAAAREQLRSGLRVRAVWAEEPSASILGIAHFAPEE